MKLTSKRLFCCLFEILIAVIILVRCVVMLELFVTGLLDLCIYDLKGAAWKLLGAFCVCPIWDENTTIKK